MHITLPPALVLWRTVFAPSRARPKEKGSKPFRPCPRALCYPYPPPYLLCLHLFLCGCLVWLRRAPSLCSWAARSPPPHFALPFRLLPPPSPLYHTPQVHTPHSQHRWGCAYKLRAARSLPPAPTPPTRTLRGPARAPVAGTVAPWCAAAGFEAFAVAACVHPFTMPNPPIHRGASRCSLTHHSTHTQTHRTRFAWHGRSRNAPPPLWRRPPP
jgi:hypothetical protein